MKRFYVLLAVLALVAFIPADRAAAVSGDALRAVLAGMPEVRRRVSVDVDPLTVL